MRLNNRRCVFRLVLGLGCVPGPDARAQAIGQGFELERQGRLEPAAALYAAALRVEPANLPALLGLERVLPALRRLRELAPLVRQALAVDSGSALRGLAVRTWTALGESDSAAAVARRWAAAAPLEPAPWREWAIALEDHQHFEEAQGVLIEGRHALGRSDALAIELAELAQRSGDWLAAALEWAAAVAAAPAQHPNAAAQLVDVPLDQRDRVARALSGAGSTVPARRLAAELLVQWGQPERGWEVLATTIDPATPATAVVALRRFAETVRGTTPGAQRARGQALTRLADLLPEPLSSRARAEAGRALLDAGDRTAARAVLLRLADDPAAPADAQALAQAALVEALIDDGQLDSAAASLARLETDPRASGTDRERLRHALVGAWIRAGRLERADAVLGADSSVEALAMRGWVRLYRGELRPALDAFRSAGPYTGDRDAATARTRALALLEQIDAERSPELGMALLALARGDSAAAVAGLRRTADRLNGDGGRPDVLLLAGQIASRLGGQQGTAGELLAEVVRTDSGAAAPAAELEWARLLLRQSRPADAVAHLEHLILTYPGSALVPDARRELERVKGAIPRS